MPGYTLPPAAQADVGNIWRYVQRIGAIHRLSAIFGEFKQHARLWVMAHGMVSLLAIFALATARPQSVRT